MQALSLKRLIAMAFLVAPVVACRGERRWRGTPVQPVRKIPAFAFTDSAGRAIQLNTPKGAATLVFFGYANCPDVCPTALGDWTRVRKALGSDTARVHFVFVTVDPTRDTPAVVARYVAQFDSTFVGVSTDSATTAEVQRAFGAASRREPAAIGEPYLVSHSAESFLVNDRNQLVVTYAMGAGWDAMASDIHALLH
jgi:protein SCO1/2